jgi:hypothetical protein
MPMNSGSRAGPWLRMDLASVDTLARMQLAASRLGIRVRLSPSEEMLELLELCGLVEVLGEIEEREDPLRVEEEGELGDTAA